MSKYRYFLQWVKAASEARTAGREVYGIKSRQPEAWGFV